MTYFLVLCLASSSAAQDQGEEDVFERIDRLIRSAMTLARAGNLERACTQAEEAGRLIEGLPAAPAEQRERAKLEELRWECVRHANQVCEATREGSVAGTRMALVNLSTKFGSLWKAHRPRGANRER